jgi:hypothetical protein
MLLYGLNPVYGSGTSHDLSTRTACFEKLFISGPLQSVGLQTMFQTLQDVEITVENNLVHRTQQGLSTTTIEI